MNESNHQHGANNFKPLFFALLTLFMVVPFFHGMEDAEEIFTAGFCLVILHSVFSLGLVGRSKHFIVAGIIVITVCFIDYATSYVALDYASLFIYISFLGFAIYKALGFILGTKNVNANIILGAVCVYLLMGIVWGMVYTLLNCFIPNSFSVSTPANPEIINLMFKHFIYYSMTTLTTLGFGDIVPLTSPARYFSTIEAASGQIYLSVLVARLVGIHISQK